MGDTQEPVRRPELAAECVVASTLLDTYYRPLVRLAALLTGDADKAEVIARDALAALRPRSPLGQEPSQDALRYLQHQVLIRCRNRRPPAAVTRTRRRPGARPSAPTGAACPAGPDHPGAADFAGLPIVRALQDLPRRGREAVVLTHYLDLSEHQAAVIAGVTEAVLRQRLGLAMRVLRDRFPDGWGQPRRQRGPAGAAAADAGSGSTTAATALG
jgi:DNA-directed RNA polymerase specialized sigma24 family protein